jgi:hypothetical protein
MAEFLYNLKRTLFRRRIFLLNTTNLQSVMEPPLPPPPEFVRLTGNIPVLIGTQG